MYQGIVVHPDGTWEQVGIGSMDDLIRIVDGWLEDIAPGQSYYGFAPWHAWVDGDARAKDKPMNLVATGLAQMLGWQDRIMTGDFIAGDALFVGLDGPDDVDVPESLARIITYNYPCSVGTERSAS